MDSLTRLTHLLLACLLPLISARARNAMPEAVYGGKALTSPCYGAATDAPLLVLSAGTGDILQLAPDGKLASISNTGGEPSALTFDAEGVLYVCDLAHAAVLRRGADGALTEFVAEHEGRRAHDSFAHCSVVCGTHRPAHRSPRAPQERSRRRTRS